MRSPAPERRLGLLAAAMFLWSACGMSALPLEGAWTVTDGSVTLVCDGGTVTEPVAGSVVVIDRMHGDLFASIDGQAELLTGGGDTATLGGSQVILLTDDAGFLDSWTLTLTSDTLSVAGNTL